MFRLPVVSFIISPCQHSNINGENIGFPMNPRGWFMLGIFVLLETSAYG